MGRLLYLVLLFYLVCAHSAEALAQAKPAFADFEFCVTPDGRFALYKPKGWKIGTETYPDRKTLSLADAKDLSHVNLVFFETIDPRHDSVSFAKTMLQRMGKQIPDLSIIEARTNPQRTQTVVRMQRRGPNRTLLEGKYAFNVAGRTGLALGYEAPAKQFKEIVPTLMTILANITMLDDQALKKWKSQKTPSEALLPMGLQKSPDGSCQLLVPEGWNLMASKGTALCSSASGDIGFLFTVIDFVGQAQIPYFDSSSVPGNLRYNYMPPAEAMGVAMGHYGWRNQKILERHPNPQLAQEASGMLKRRVDAEVALISSTSKSGATCFCYFDILGLHPTYAGQWGIIVTGLWAPENTFGRHLPSLIKIAESFEIDEQWAKDYVHRGIKKLKELMNKTSSMMSRYAEEMRQSSLAAHQNRMKSSDFIDYKFATYMRGQQEWVSALEGGKIYTSDHWGLSSDGKTIIEGQPFNYYNYKGEFKDANLPVDISREVFEAVKGRP